MKDYWKTIDTVVMGRKTYEIALRHGSSSEAGMKTYVFSRTLKQSEHPNVKIVVNQPGSFDASKTLALVSAGLSAHPDVSIVMVHDPDQTKGAASAITSAGKKLGTDINYSEAGITVRETRDLWNMPVVFLALLMLRSAEPLRVRETVVKCTPASRATS